MVLITTLVSLAANIGANRIVPGIAIPHPVGDPSKPAPEERRLRLDLVRKALATLAAG